MHRAFRFVSLLAALGLVPGAAGAQVVFEGRVTDEGGAPVADADLDFFDAQTGFRVDPSADGHEGQSDRTDSFGSYRMVVKPEVYHVRWEPPAERVELAPIFARNVIVGSDTVLDVTLPRGSRLTGLVTDRDGFPVPGVDLALRDPVTGERAATVNDETGTDGRYALTVVRGTWDVAFRPAPGTGAGPIEIEGVDLARDATLDAVLPRGFLISGVVVREGGPAVPFADLDAELVDGRRRVPTSDDDTDGTGRFSVVVPEGTLNVFLTPPRGLPYAPAARWGVVADSDLDLGTITLVPGVVFTGTVRDAGGAPVPGADLDLQVPGSCDRYPVPEGVTDADGRFFLRVEEGSWDVVVTPPAGSPLSARLFPDVDVTGGLDTELALASGSEPVAATSRVVGDDGAPVAGVLVRGEPLQAGVPFEATTGEDGRFSIEAARGRWRLAFEPPGGGGRAPFVLKAVELPCGVPSAVVLPAISVPPPSSSEREIRGFPNPWSASTRVAFVLPRAAPDAVLEIFDATGRRVRTLHRGALPAGPHEIPWDGLDREGFPSASGVYLVRLRGGGVDFSGRISRIRR